MVVKLIIILKPSFFHVVLVCKEFTSFVFNDVVSHFVCHTARDLFDLTEKFPNVILHVASFEFMTLLLYPFASALIQTLSDYTSERRSLILSQSAQSAQFYFFKVDLN